MVKSSFRIYEAFWLDCLLERVLKFDGTVHSSMLVIREASAFCLVKAKSFGCLSVDLN